MQSNRIGIVRVTFLVMAILIAAAPQAIGQSSPVSKTYVTVGTGEVPQAGPNAVKDKAIRACKRTAVEQMTAELLALDVLIQQFEAIDKMIYEQADQFIQYYKVLNERRDGSTYRVLVQVKVSGQMIKEKLRSAGILSADARPVSPLSLSVVGTENLSSFVLFRSTLNKMPGVEDVQISEMLPNQTTLAVAYRGAAADFAEALLRQPHEGYGIRVYQESDQAYRIDLAPAEAAPQPN